METRADDRVGNPPWIWRIPSMMYTVYRHDQTWCWDLGGHQTRAALPEPFGDESFLVSETSVLDDLSTSLADRLFP